MSTSAQIRLLLAIVCATFLLTAVIVKQTFTPKVNLEQTGIIVQSNLNYKEAIVNKLINNKAEFNKLKHITNDAKAAIDFINYYTTDNRVWVFTYYNNQVNFWTGVKVFPDRLETIKEGSQFIKQKNGSFQVIKKTEGNFTALFFIPVKNTYYFQNRYLQDGFDKPILDDDHVDIADITDKVVYNIHAVNHSYLFSIKLKPGFVNHRFYYFELILWALGFITLCTLIHNTCNYLVLKGYLFTAFGVLSVFICLIRFINIAYNWPNLSGFELFDPKIYNANAMLPSLGHFCINMLAACWLASFIFHHRHRILKTSISKNAAYGLTLLSSIVLVVLATLLLRLYGNMVTNSRINFDVTNVFNLSVFSFWGISMLCFSFLLFYLVADTFLAVTRRLAITDRQKALVFFGVILGTTLIGSIQNDFNTFYILVGLFILIRAYVVWYGDGKLNATSLLCLITVCSLISATRLIYFQDIKANQVHKELVQKLEIAKDDVADSAFRKIEPKIITDADLLSYFNDTARNDSYLKTQFQKNYFDGYLSKYELKVYVFNSTGQPITSDKSYLLNDFKDQVAYSSIRKVSKYFYHENENFGFQNYFAILPVKYLDKNLGTVVVTLKSTPLLANATFPELLVDGEIKPDAAFKDYSYAFYFDGKLMIQNGKYAYSLQNNNYKGLLKQYVTKITPVTNSVWYRPFEHTRHLIYQSDERRMIVVSNDEDLLAQGVTCLTFFFVSILCFSAIIIFTTWLWARIRIFNVKNKQLKWSFKINVDQILYRSRIQFSVIFTVVFTLLIIGAITFQSISNQYKDQQDEMIRNKITRIGAAFEVGLQNNIYNTSQAGKVSFNDFANNNLVDLTLYDKSGVELLTTQPKLYDYSLLASRMNGKAYIAMNTQHQSEFLNNERLGELKYKAAYVPITDKHYNTLAYLQLPYFSNEADYNDRIGSLLNAMINVYALVFIAIGLFAVVIARQITSPLTFIQYNLSKTIYGQKNEPIVWDRDDEIGALVKEYNKMIAELENSAQRLAQSERESAWREMAKQVAHEIKNPLTPLKLGLQLLDKAWKDKDPKFDQKFERFSKSFVEQIESLSSIASEFSAFAKMPDTRLEVFNLFEVIGQAVIIFRQMDNVTIDFNPGQPFFIRADRDQLLRCFNNLLKNAIEAMPDARPGIINITHKFTSGYVLLTVTDNGNGIPENLREKIFAPNFTTKSSGTGLGLAFVKNSIENAGGKVWFETETNKGTTFFMSLPAVVV